MYVHALLSFKITQGRDPDNMRVVRAGYFVAVARTPIW